jgi:hypothetical protein
MLAIRYQLRENDKIDKVDVHSLVIMSRVRNTKVKNEGVNIKKRSAKLHLPLSTVATLDRQALECDPHPSPTEIKTR